MRLFLVEPTASVSDSAVAVFLSRRVNDCAKRGRRNRDEGKVFTTDFATAS